MAKRSRKKNSNIHALIDGAPAQRNFSLQAGTITDTERQVIRIRTNPVMWGIPCDELGYSKFWIHFMRHANWMPWDGFAGSEGTYLIRARNSIHNAFLDSGLDHLMMLDSDVLFPPDTLYTLMSHNLPIVAGWYRDKKAPNRHPCVYDYDGEQEDGISVWRHRNKPGSGLEQVGATGAGCILMTQEVAQKLGKDPYGSKLGGGEDMVMCRKLIESGIPLYVDWNINCAHAGVGIT